jgi:predicted lipid-binding transport protein (Tim44 family)
MAAAMFPELAAAEKKPAATRKPPAGTDPAEILFGDGPDSPTQTPTQAIETEDDRRAQVMFGSGPDPQPPSPFDEPAEPKAAPDEPEPFEQQQSKAIEQMVSGWEQQARAEFADDLDGTLARARGVVEQYGDDDLRELIRDGLGNHPAFIRFADRIASEVE